MPVTRICLWICAAALLAVGFVSHSIERHAIQVIPLVTLAAFLKRDWAPISAALLLFWFLIVALIWLYVLGLAQIITGDFSTSEIALTVVIGVACVVGFVDSLSAMDRKRLLRSAGLFLAAFAVQFAALWTSYAVPGLNF